MQYQRPGQQTRSTTARSLTVFSRSPASAHTRSGKFGKSDKCICAPRSNSLTRCAARRLCREIAGEQALNNGVAIQLHSGSTQLLTASCCFIHAVAGWRRALAGWRRPRQLRIDIVGAFRGSDWSAPNAAEFRSSTSRGPHEVVSFAFGALESFKTAPR